MKRFVRIYHYPSRTEKFKEFITEKDAVEYFTRFSDEHNLEYCEYNGLIVESGGIGHDYCVELIDSNLITEYNFKSNCELELV